MTPNTFYKAVRLDGTDFWTATVAWVEASGLTAFPRVVRHPTSRIAVRGDHSTSLAVSTTPWNLSIAPYDHRQMRLLTVEPTDALVLNPFLGKRQSIEWRVTGEIESWHRYGPMGEHIAALIERLSVLTADESTKINAVWNSAWEAIEPVAAWDATVDATRGAAWNAAGDAAWNVTWNVTWNVAEPVGQGGVAAAARGAAGALSARDLIGQYDYTQEHYDTLTRPLRLAGITVHPDDAPLEETS